MALFTTFITTPTVMAIYKPARGNGVSSTSNHRKLQSFSSTPGDSKDELKILACLHGPGNIPSLITLIESSRSSKNSSLKLFIMHLIELTERSSSIIMIHRLRKNGLPFINRLRRGEWHDRVAGAFQAYSQLGRVSVRSTKAISPLSTMHEDICEVAESRKITMIILPFHKQWRGEEGEESMENIGHGWRMVNQRVLKNAPCSVAIFVDRGFGNGNQSPGPKTVAQKVCILFFGGPNDREALQLGGRMAEHPAIKVSVIRFVEREKVRDKPTSSQASSSLKSEQSYGVSTSKINRENEKELDETCLAEFRSKWAGIAEYIEKTSSNIVEGALAIGRSKEYHLIVVGKGWLRPSSMVAELSGRHAENAELGPIGDALSSGLGVVSSVLVIQQHEHEEETSSTKFVHAQCQKLEANVSSEGAGKVSKVV